MSKEIMLDLIIDNGNDIYDKQVRMIVQDCILYNDFAPFEFTEFYEDISRNVNGIVKNVSVATEEILNASELGAIAFDDEDSEDFEIISDEFNYLRTIDYTYSDYTSAVNEVEKMRDGAEGIFNDIVQMYEDNEDLTADDLYDSNYIIYYEPFYKTTVFYHHDESVDEMYKDAYPIAEISYSELHFNF